ncbi:glycosyltransferase family 2 protein [Streptococcus sp. UMB0029]|uniref:glycosyltransferase family 2 protein n=1 Tax=Streptococcus sp. UMB0029 TaxID=2069308 RepID=UPI000C80E72B|nr:glycosyltransferase family 2 protein [Streptococcus sp. UMB0029]PMC00618.1 glycosyltransferase family 2 protein [Streptococcus sp. UMB0029]
MNKITVFTPTFNRGYLMNKLFHSLNSQTNKHFEWLIVDDGSIDQTGELVETFKEQADFEIRYFYQQNGGKHRAINHGLDLARGELFFIVDSDDSLTDDAIEKIFNNYSGIAFDNSFAGIAFNKGFSKKRIVGETFEGTYIDCDNLHRGKHNILGDKAEVYRTDILKSIKFPVVDGENFMSEVVLWNEVARRGYKLRWFNDIIYFCDYLEDGLTKNSEKILFNNPVAHQMMTKELLQIDFTLKRKFGMIYNYHKIRNQSIKQTAINLEQPLILVYMVVMMARIRKIVKGVKNE